MAELNTLEQWYYDVPIVTRIWTTAAVITSVLVRCDIITPFQLFYNFNSVWAKKQVSLSSPLPFYCLCAEEEEEGLVQKKRS